MVAIAGWAVDLVHWLVTIKYIHLLNLELSPLHAFSHAHMLHGAGRLTNICPIKILKITQSM